MRSSARAGLLIAALVSIAAVVAWWLAGTDPLDVETIAARVDSGAEVPRAADLLEAGELEQSRVERTAAVAAPEPPSDSDPGESSRSEAATVALTFDARLLAADGAPVEGGVLLALDGDGATTHAGAPSGPDGLAVIEVELPPERATGRGNDTRYLHERESMIQLVGSLGALRSDPRPGTIRPGERVSLGDLTLTPRGSVFGTVLQDDSTPAPKAWLTTTPGLDRRFPVTHDGEFLLEHVPCGSVEVRLYDSWYGGRPLAAESMEVRPGESSGPLELVLAGAPLTRPVRGRVIDAEGTPVSGILITDSEGGYWSQDSETGSAGEFGLSVPLEPRNGPLSLTFFDPESRFLAARVLNPPAELTVRLERAARLELLVVGPDGPAPWPWVRLDPGLGIHDSVREIQGREDGTASTSLPGQPFHLHVYADGYEERLLSDVSPDGLPSPFVVELERGAAVHGRVHHRGRGVAEAKVSLTRRVTGGVSAKSSAAPPLFPTPFDIVAWPGGLAERQTGADGTFVIPLQSSGSFGFRVEAPGFATASFGPFDWERGQTVRGIELEVVRGGRIEGLVLTRPDREATDWVVGVSNGDGIARTQLPGADGHFAFDNLAPGGWQVRLCSPSFSPRQPLRAGSGGASEDAVEWDLRVQSEVTTTYDLDLRSHRAFLVRGTAPLAEPMRLHVPVGTDLSLVAPEDRWERFKYIGRDSETSTAEEDGAFEIALSRPGAHVLQFRNPERHVGWFHWFWNELVQVAEGAQTWQTSKSWGVVRIELSPEIEPESMLLFTWNDGRSAGQIPHALGDEREATLWLPAGTGRLVHYSEFYRDPAEPESEGYRASASASVEVEVPTSGELRLRLPLGGE